MAQHTAEQCSAHCRSTGKQVRRRLRRTTFAKPRLEPLESRLLMAVSPAEWNGSLGHGFICSCPICSGQGLDAIPVATEVAGSLAQSNPLSSLPQLNSNAGAAAKLFLDFNGHFESSWGGDLNVSTPVFDRDNNLATFSDGELSAIYEIWARVAEDYAPFNINVTTVDPGHQANQVVAVIAIGGNWSDWYGSSAGGVAYVGGFYNSAPNVGYVFDDALGNGNAKYVAEAASHEAGHLFGLWHQATWSGSTLVEPYSDGDGSTWAPIMGVGYYVPRTTWHNGTSNNGPTAFQDDLAILTNANNGFGYRGDDVGNTRAAAAALPASGTSVNFSRLIGRSNDVDVWSFTTSGGTVNVQLAGAQFGSNLDAVLELWDTSGTLAMSSPSNSLGASISLSVGAGTYYLVARSLGDYGDMGRYTVTGTIPPSVAAPPSAATIIDDGATGNTLVGAWKLKTGTGYGNDLRQAAKGTGSINARWTFNNLAACQYRVWVTYRISSVNATDAPFTLYNGNTTVRTVRVNQRLTPASLEANGARWQSLGNVWINSGRLVVKLTNAANGQVVADAVRIERVVTSGALAAALTAPSSAGQSTVPVTNHRPATASAVQQAASASPEAAELSVLRSVVDLLRWARQGRHEQSAIDELAADERTWLELLVPLT